MVQKKFGPKIFGPKNAHKKNGKKKLAQWKFGLKCSLVQNMYNMGPKKCDPNMGD